MTQEFKQEEQFLLRVLDQDVASRIRAVLRAEPRDPNDKDINLKFTSDREAQLTVGQDSYGVSLMNLPTVVETYRTMDDENLIKVGDVGQMLLVRPKGMEVPGSTSTSGGVPESPHGLTSGMAHARERRFRPSPKLSVETVQRVEREILTVLGGGAPDNMKYVDYEELYAVNEGSWKVVK